MSDSSVVPNSEASGGSSRPSLSMNQIRKDGSYSGAVHNDVTATGANSTINYHTYYGLSPTSTRATSPSSESASTGSFWFPPPAGRIEPIKEAPYNPNHKPVSNDIDDRLSKAIKGFMKTGYSRLAPKNDEDEASTSATAPEPDK